MIHYFKCSNFHSINEEVTLDFRVSKSVGSKGPGYAQSLSDPSVYLSKVIAIFGPNASGKTNVIRVLSFLAWFISSSFETGPKAIEPEGPKFLPLVPYIFGNRKDKTVFEVVFEIGSNLYKYHIETHHNKHLLSEELFLMNPATHHYNLLFSRTKQAEGGYDFQQKGYQAEIPEASINIETASIISIASQFRHAQSANIADYWNGVSFATNIHLRGRIDLSSNRKLLSAYTGALAESPNSIKKMVELLQLAGVRISDIEPKKITFEETDTLGDEPKKITYHPFFEHSVNGIKQEVRLPFEHESSGVQSLYMMLFPIIHVLESASAAPVVLDEMDSGIHPDVIPQIIRVFTSVTKNKNNHQLIITLHSNQVMDSLEKYQIYITENQHGFGTKLLPLDSIKGIRKDIRYSSAYRAGRFGGLPVID